MRIAYCARQPYLCTPKNKEFHEHEPRNIANRPAEHRLEHHRSAHGHRRHRHRRTLGQRKPGRHHRRPGHRRLDLQLHLLELFVRPHGHERPDRPGLRRRRLPRMHPHAGPLAERFGRHGPRRPPVATPPGRVRPADHERKPDRQRLLLRPHLGRAGGYSALRLQRLVYRHAERPDPHADRHHGQRDPHPLQPLVRLRLRHGNRRHRLRIGRGTDHGRRHRRRRPPPSATANCSPASTGARCSTGTPCGASSPSTATSCCAPSASWRSTPSSRPYPPAWRRGIGCQYAAAATLHPLLLYERRLRAGGRSPHGTFHRRT